MAEVKRATPHWKERERERERRSSPSSVNDLFIICIGENGARSNLIAGSERSSWEEDGGTERIRDKSPSEEHALYIRYKARYVAVVCRISYSRGELHYRKFVDCTTALTCAWTAMLSRESRDACKASG